jgi:hypothetical protein
MAQLMSYDDFVDILEIKLMNFGWVKRPDPFYHLWTKDMKLSFSICKTTFAVDIMDHTRFYFFCSNVSSLGTPIHLAKFWHNSFGEPLAFLPQRVWFKNLIAHLISISQKQRQSN